MLSRHVPKSALVNASISLTLSSCLLILSLMLSACATSDANSSESMTVSSDPSSSTRPDENNTSWQITAWEQGGRALTSLPTVELSIDLEAQQISGFSGCNSFGGSFTLADGGEIAIGPLRSTQRGCDQAVMEQETQFLEAIQSANQIRAEENQLILSYTLDQTENNLYFSRM